MANRPVFGNLYTLDRFVYRQNSTIVLHNQGDNRLENRVF